MFHARRGNKNDFRPERREHTECRRTCAGNARENLNKFMECVCTEYEARLFNTCPLRNSLPRRYFSPSARGPAPDAKNGKTSPNSEAYNLTFDTRTRNAVVLRGLLVGQSNTRHARYIFHPGLPCALNNL